MGANQWSVGDWLIYRKPKQSPSPGPRAQNVMAATKGENYIYTVDKYWIVTEILDDGQLVAQTMRGKQHRIPANAAQIRKPRFWERWLLRDRFQQIERSLREKSGQPE